MIDWILATPNDFARLPALVVQQWWLVVGWSVVLAWLGAWLASRWTLRKDAIAALATCLAVWVGLPGPWGGAYWLGLAFQAPSVTAVLLCGFLLMRVFLGPAHPVSMRNAWSPDLFFMALCGVVLGWVLLLDTLGVLPGSLYNWGFSAVAPAIVIVVASLGWVFAKRNPMGGSNLGSALPAIAVVLFVFFHLPSGNVFDALMDPGLWLALQIAMFQQWTKKNLRGLHRTG
jgi:hypothetical protein